MKKSSFIKNLLILNFSIITFCVHPQSEYFTLTFTGDNNGQYITLDSVFIRNLTQGSDTMLYDTAYTVSGFESVQISNPGKFELLPNYPNPVTDQSRFNILIPEEEELMLSVYNSLGQQILQKNYQLKSGNHVFCFYPGNDKFYVLVAETSGVHKSLKVLSPFSERNGKCSILYESWLGEDTGLKSDIIVDFPLYPGDYLLLVGYSELGESGFTDAPDENMDYTFQFATNIPCPGLDSLNYEGQWYQTIQVYSQCWFKENLNVGTWIQSSQPQTNNNVIEKYCMADMSLGCELFGGLYKKFEMMNYIYESGGQGICPEGWHVPLDMDWQILEGSIDSEFGIGDPVWNSTGWRGSDAGGNLKQVGTSLWTPPNLGATDAFGFNLLPAGYFVQNEFWGPEYKTYLYTSDYPDTYLRNVDYDKMNINKDLFTGTDAAISVRCIKNHNFID